MLVQELMCLWVCVDVREGMLQMQFDRRKNNETASMLVMEYGKFYFYSFLPHHTLSFIQLGKIPQVSENLLLIPLTWMDHS